MKLIIDGFGIHNSEFTVDSIDLKFGHIFFTIPRNRLSKILELFKRKDYVHTFHIFNDDKVYEYKGYTRSISRNLDVGLETFTLKVQCENIFESSTRTKLFNFCNLPLPPCPFCGFIPDVEDEDCIYPASRDFIEVIENSNKPFYTLYSINCYESGGGCSASILGSSKDDVIQKWKMRIKI